MVKSGPDTEYRASVFLIAGRSYPIRLEVYKGRELNDKKKEARRSRPRRRWRCSGRCRAIRRMR